MTAALIGIAGLALGAAGLSIVAIFIAVGENKPAASRGDFTTLVRLIDHRASRANDYPGHTSARLLQSDLRATFPELFTTDERQGSHDYGRG